MAWGGGRGAPPAPYGGGGCGGGGGGGAPAAPPLLEQLGRYRVGCELAHRTPRGHGLDAAGRERFVGAEPEQVVPGFADQFPGPG